MPLDPSRYQRSLRSCFSHTLLRHNYYPSHRHSHWTTAAASPSIPSTTQHQRPFRRTFHSSQPRCDTAAGGLPDHYETLELQSNASPTDIKKQFYKLSKAHHPDRNPSDPNASNRFVKITEAYSVLGSQDKRARYDRDFFRSNPHHHHSPQGGRHRPTGSYSSSSSSSSSSSNSDAYSGPGGRPASGLSKRRTQFKGPPPSFYRSGGWGTQSAKRAEHASRASHAAHEEQQHAPQPRPPPGTGPAGFAQGYGDDVPHFDREGHRRTHESVERTRHQTKRRTKGEVALDEMRDTGPSMLFNFILISGILTLVFGVSGAVLRGPSAASSSSSGGGVVATRKRQAAVSS
ncbi:hypothetical protein AAFC00_003180 [Neodothiora populina]|uniref:J domain-containing protein n=1 Tax=Neodothiora populina TaxID=2781224 RepID=A0ABR3P9L8_9PEZI